MLCRINRYQYYFLIEFLDYKPSLVHCSFLYYQCTEKMSKVNNPYTFFVLWLYELSEKEKYYECVFTYIRKRGQHMHGVKLHIQTPLYEVRKT